MNKIELKSELHEETDDVQHFVCKILVDNKNLVNFHSLATRLTELRESADRDGTYSILTCWCGVDDCAGILEGIKVTHKKNTVEWEMPYPKPKRQYIFDSIEYRQAIESGIEQIKRDVNILWFATDGGKNANITFVPELSGNDELLKPKYTRKKFGRRRKW